MARFDIDQLKDVDHNLYVIASKASGHTTGIHEIDISQLKIGPEYRMRLAEWAVVPKAPTPITPVEPPPPPPAPTEPQINMAELEAEQQRDLQKRVDQARATNRLNEYAAVGLEETQHNFDLIKNFVETSAAKGYWSYEIVEVAIAYLKNQLTWKPAAAPAPESEPEPTEVLTVLADGTTQLSLTVDNHTLRKASKLQARDYLKRVDQRSRERGRFSSKFI